MEWFNFYDTSPHSGSIAYVCENFDRQLPVWTRGWLTPQNLLVHPLREALCHSESFTWFDALRLVLIYTVAILFAVHLVTLSYQALSLARRLLGTFLYLISIAGALLLVLVVIQQFTSI